MSDPAYFSHQTAVIDEGAIIGAGTKIWHFTHVMSGAQIGDACVLGQNVFVAGGVVLGNRVKIQNNVSIYQGVTCEDDVFVGPSAVFTNVLNPRSAIDRRNEFASTHISKGATIGANATIVCGCQLGRYAFIGAGAVVTGDVLDFALMVGNPAKHVGWMSRNGHRLQFDTDQQAQCPQSKEIYTLRGSTVTIVHA